MATWEEFERSAPQCAAVAERVWPGITALDRGERAPPSMPCFRVAYLATVRTDGAPRLHPFCPILAAGMLFAAIPLSSPKGRDLRRDSRCVVHAMPGPEDDELCIRAQASEITDEVRRQAVATVVARSGVGGMIESVRQDPIFHLDIVRVDVAKWINIGKPGTYAHRMRWPSA
jgi:hypothetical protein